MILFMVSPPAGKSPERYLIPLRCSENAKADIEKRKVRFISWNEADYELNEEIIVHIINIDTLKVAVYNAAMKDEDVCGIMIEQFKVRYGIDIRALWFDTKNPAYHIIGDVFAKWAHPMIGNVVVSSGIRPQTAGEQYIKNWDSFPNDYMTVETKAVIKDLISESLSYDPESPKASPAGLRRPEKSGRDQVRCCKDMTELARAVIGEITTYASKKLEKIYALELCNSEKFLAAQKEFIKCIVLDPSEKTITVNPKLKSCFFDRDKPIKVTEYIYFYFPQLAKFQKDDQWIAFIHLLNTYLGIGCVIPCEKLKNEKDSEILDLCVREFCKFPPIIRGAMIINAIRKFPLPARANGVERYSFEIEDKDIMRWKIVEAPGKSFIPQLSKQDGQILLWNWNRDETHPVTAGYRKCLIPLWAGPSGHSAGLMDYYYKYLNKKEFFTFEKRQLPISLVILPTMFAFWRLYYDKRICAVHTLAETFEGALSRALSVENRQKVLTYISNQINVEAIMVHAPKDLTYEEVFDTLIRLPFVGANIFNNTGVMHPVRILAQIRATHYDTLSEKDGIAKIDALDTIINKLRQRLTEQHYEVPRWSQPISGLQKDGSIAESAGGDAFGGLEIRSFHSLNVKVFGQKALFRLMVRRNLMERGSVARSISDSGLKSLYDKICACAASEKGYQFTYDFPELPGCYIDAYRAPFLDGILFSGIRECSLAGEAFTYRAEIRTDAVFWKSVKEMIPLADSEEIFCTVRETSGGLCFTGEIAAESAYRVADKLSLAVHRVSIESGLDDVSCFPCICIDAEIGEQFDLMIVVSPDGDRLYISGEYEEDRVLTIAGLLSLFGLDGVVQGSDLLPDEESVFGSLGLKSVSITVDTASEGEGITQIGFTVTAGKPWDIFDHKITLQPYFEMNIEYPFDSERRKADYNVLGKWHIGSTVFDLLYRSDKTIYAGLAEDSTLHFADVAGLFAKDVSFPPVELTGMEFSADVSSGDYALYLSAEHVLEFEVGKGKLGIEGLSLSLGFTGGEFGTLKLGGSFALGGVTLAVSGSYGKKTGLSFEAMAYSEEDYSLGDFIAQAARDFGQTFDRESLPDTLLSVKIRMLAASYESEKKTFCGHVDLENVLEISKDFAIRKMALKISSEQGAAVAFQVIARIHICGTEVGLTLSKNQEGFILSGEATFTDLTFGRIAGELGIATEHLPGFISEFAVTDLGVKYNFTTKEFSLRLTTSAGKISAEITAGARETSKEIDEGEQSGWRICYETDPKVSVDMLRMPLVGELVQKAAPGTTGLSVKDFGLEASSTKGVIFRCTAFGSACTLELYKPAPDRSAMQSNEALQCESGKADRSVRAAGNFSPETVKWINLNKTFAILTISKAGIGLDGSRVALLLDASLAVSPFTFSLAEAGVGINISRLSDVAFYLSGFGVAFDNGALAVSGSFYRKQREGKEVYAGSLLVKCKTVTVTAVGEYSSGSLFAYMALSASIGGPPAFFVTGLALGFGYNRRLVLPPVEQVPEYPLIKAVKKGFNDQTLKELNEYITEENGQNFLTAGVRFTSFKIVDGFLLLSVSFGKKFQIGVLGIADLSIPPNAPSNPVAKAQLAIRAEYDPSAGVFRAEARLTSESYILSRDCKLTGGFAAFFWFDGSEHSGDFVVTLGGYHPAYQKPAHYPDVPRLGLNWNINSNLSISGEIYFALTPSAAMAGGKLSAVYTQGKLRAWFIAYADFLVSWKPFSYQARIGVSLGASYRVDLWFIHKTFSIELAADLELWGPEVQGRLHVSWFIISFTISFSKGRDHSGETLDWGAFKKSFLQDEGKNHSLRADKAAPAGDTDILAVTVAGVCGQMPDGTDIIDPNGFGITLLSKIPEQGNVRPVNNAELKSAIALTVEDEHKRTINDRFQQSSVTRNVPSALWKSAPAPQDRLREESIVKDARCGVSYELKSEVRKQELFPKTRFISLEELYRNNTLAYEACFRFVSDQRLLLSDEDSIRRFSQSADSEETRKRRQKYLSDNGITEQVSITRFAKEAENWLSEELLIST